MRDLNKEADHSTEGYTPPFSFKRVKHGYYDVRDSKGELRFSFGGANAKERAKEATDRVNGVEPLTPVIFRRWPKERCRDFLGRVYWTGGDAVAIFPTLPGTSDEYTCSSYEHLGQHGACNGRGFVNRTILAKPEEYADLKKELESPPFNYRLRIYSRWQPSFDVERRKALRGMGGAGNYA